jgi:hypothetical protein
MAMAGALALAALLAGGAARAQDEALHGHAQIQEVRVVSSAVVLDGELYHVGDTTRIEDEYGVERTLAELPSVAGGGSGDEVAVWFEAGEPRVGTPRPLLLLRLTGSMPK